MNEEKQDLIPEEAPPKTIVQSAKDFMNGVLSPLKGKDVGQLVEDFTAEMALVAEGLSEDQEKLSQENEKLAAQQTLLEQNLLDQLHDANVTISDLQKEVDVLRHRLENAEKSIGEKKMKKVEGFTGLLRQATWLAGVVIGGWIIVTIINFFK
ncbi:MAG: hypothetical protein IJ189_08285 [Clostridia bacterium]|nr:hypothetical protein [Clostridia bacterium]